MGIIIFDKGGSIIIWTGIFGGLPKASMGYSGSFRHLLPKPKAEAEAKADKNGSHAPLRLAAQTEAEADGTEIGYCSRCS